MKNSTGPRAQPADSVDVTSTAATVGQSRRRVVRGPWNIGFVALALIVVAWLAYFVLPNYITLNPKRAAIQLDPAFPPHYILLIIHVASGTTALLAGCAQFWPWLRRTHPLAHRVIGRFYVPAVLLAAPSALVLAGVRLSVSGFISGQVIGGTLWAFLWFGVTVAAYNAGRKRRFVEHRRLMVYSYALTLAILWSRIVLVIVKDIPGFKLIWFFENTNWLPWVVNLLVAQWWLNRTAARRRAARAKPPAVVAQAPTADSDERATAA